MASVTVCAMGIMSIVPGALNVTGVVATLLLYSIICRPRELGCALTEELTTERNGSSIHVMLEMRVAFVATVSLGGRAKSASFPSAATEAASTRKD